MSPLKENLQIQSEGAVIATQESAYKVKQWFFGIPAWERVLIIVMLALLIPGYFIIRYGSQFVYSQQYARESVTAQPAFSNPDPLQITKVTIIENSIGTYSAYSTVTNPNLDLALPNIEYTYKFYDSSGDEVATTDGQTYLLPDEQKLILVPRVVSSDRIVSGKIELESPQWQKRLSLPEVELRMSEPYVYEELNPLATSAEGSVVNNSEFNIKQASLVLVLYGNNNEVIAVTQREEFSLQPYERRAYKLSWPGILRANVKKVELKAYTNTLDENNLSVGTTSRSTDRDR